MRVDYSVTLLVSLLSSAGFWAMVQWFVSRKHRETERETARQRDWFDEAEAAYKRVNDECSDCKKELQKVKDDHLRQLGALRRELSDVKDALVSRADALDELLPYVEGIPDDKIREIRSANRAVRAAVWRAQT